MWGFMPTINGKGQATVFTREELTKFFKVVKSDRYYLTLFKCLYYSGERSGCVLQLKWSDVDFVNNLINFRPETRKGGIPRNPVPIHLELRDYLTKMKNLWLDECDDWQKKTGLMNKFWADYVFFAKKSAGHTHRCVVDAKFRKLLLECGFENKGFSLHSFRRTFITRIYEENRNVKECMHLTGHKTVQHFMAYVEIDPKNIPEMINSL